jgi:hypothetical protein
MATTGSATFNEAADNITNNHPLISRSAVEGLRSLDAMLPYVYDAVHAYHADRTNYPSGGGTGIDHLDVTMILIGGLAHLL